MAKEQITNPLKYEGVFLNFASFWRETELYNKQVIFWKELPPAAKSMIKTKADELAPTHAPYWGTIVGLTNIGDEVLLHIKMGDNVTAFIPLSQAIGDKGFEIRTGNEETDKGE